VKLKTREIVLLVFSLVVAAVLIGTACSQAAQPASKTTSASQTTSAAPAPATVTVTVTKATSYNCLNPSGDFLPVQTKSLAARLTTIEGQTIYVVQGEADPVIMPALFERLQKDYPKTKWVYYQPSSSFGITTVDATMKAEAKAAIRGVGW
jgi:hypothetical protein